jgi:hypothetical protein
MTMILSLSPKNKKRRGGDPAAINFRVMKLLWTRVVLPVVLLTIDVPT